MAKNKRGRQKIQMVKMKKDSNLQVTFSKRRYGLFKKASELCTLCGVDIGIIVFSPGRKVFSFGNPDVRSVINRFKNYTCNPLLLVEDGPNATIQGLNTLLTQELGKLELQKGRKKTLDEIRDKRQEEEIWWQNPPNQLDLPQTDCLISALQNLRMELGNQRSQHLQSIVPYQDYYGESYNNVGGGGGNIDLFDQRNMFDVSGFNYNPNMVVPSHGPMFGYNNNNNNNVLPEVFDPRYNMNWPEYNHGHYWDQGQELARTNF